nr:leukocyte immunoglobulin-like receptor subfamily B member 4 [Castor canadensis]
MSVAPHLLHHLSPRTAVVPDGSDWGLSGFLPAAPSLPPPPTTAASGQRQEVSITARGQLPKSCRGSGASVQGQRPAEELQSSFVEEENFYAAVKDTQAEDGLELDTQGLPEEDLQGVIYAQVKHSRLRMGGATPPFPLKDVQASSDNQVNSQAAKSPGPQDVTYAQLCSIKLRQGTTALTSSQSEELS